MGRIAVIAAGAVLLLFAGSSLATAASDPRVPTTGTLEREMIEVRAALAAQAEARDRQADAFSAAAGRMEFVNGALVAAIALAGIGGSLLAIRWVRDFANKQVAAQITTAIRATGQEIFEADSADLVEKYEERFAETYKQYKRLVGKNQ